MKRIISLLIFIFISIIPVYGQHVDVVYATDDNYVIYTLISIYSVLSNNASNSDYTFYIVENGISESNKNLMKSYVEKRGQKIEFLYVDPTMLDKENRLYAGKYITPISLARIIMPDILPKEVHKIIYVDGDTIITGDFRDFYNMDLENRILGMVYENEGELISAYCGNPHYYNAGIILIDLDKWRKENITKLLLKDLEKNYEKYTRYADQDLINCAMYSEITPLPLYWNNQVAFEKTRYDIHKSGMLHYYIVKPWNALYLSRKYEAYNKYFSYWNKSGLRKYKYTNMLRLIKKNLYMAKIKKIWEKVKPHRYFYRNWAYDIYYYYLSE